MLCLVNPKTYSVGRLLNLLAQFASGVDNNNVLILSALVDNSVDLVGAIAIILNVRGQIHVVRQLSTSILLAVVRSINEQNDSIVIGINGQSNRSLSGGNKLVAILILYVVNSAGLVGAVVAAGNCNLGPLIGGAAVNIINSDLGLGAVSSLDGAVDGVLDYIAGGNVSGVISPQLNSFRTFHT